MSHRRFPAPSAAHQRSPSPTRGIQNCRASAPLAITEAFWQDPQHVALQRSCGFVAQVARSHSLAFARETLFHSHGAGLSRLDSPLHPVSPQAPSKRNGEREITEFLTHLAVDKHVAASTQNQAFAALLFLYQKVLDRNLDFIDNVERVKRPAKLPVVFTPAEARAVLAHLKADYRLMAELLYGSGLRLMECLRLRIKDIDFGYNRITVRDAKGLRDRVTLLPQRLQRPLRGQIARVEELHRQDIARGGGRVYLPFALERKYPNAARELTWQYLFPAAKPSLDPRSGETRRHHVS
jgi:integron integrase